MSRICLSTLNSPPPNLLFRSFNFWDTACSVRRGERQREILSDWRKMSFIVRCWDKRQTQCKISSSRSAWTSRFKFLGKTMRRKLVVTFKIFPKWAAFQVNGLSCLKNLLLCDHIVASLQVIFPQISLNISNN